MSPEERRALEAAVIRTTGGVPVGLDVAAVDVLIAARVTAALDEAAKRIHADLWREGDRQTRRRSYPAGVAWRSAANIAERIVRGLAPPT